MTTVQFYKEEGTRNPTKAEMEQLQEISGILRQSFGVSPYHETGKHWVEFEEEHNWNWLAPLDRHRNNVTSDAATALNQRNIDTTLEMTGNVLWLFAKNIALQIMPYKMSRSTSMTMVRFRMKDEAEALINNWNRQIDRQHNLRESALSKLTQEEREALGFKDWNPS